MSRIEEIKAEIARLQNELTAIQDACSHPPLCVRYQHDANTGNWDRGDDCYWTKLHCTLCTKRWTADGSIDGGVGSVRVPHGEVL